MTSLNVGFRNLSHRKLFDAADKVHTGMSDPNHPYYSAIGPDIALLGQETENFRRALAEPTSTPVAAIREACRAKLIPLMVQIAHDVEKIAQGDIVILTSSGFTLGKVPVRHVGPLPAPLDVRAKHTGLNGQVMIQSKAVKGASSYESRCSLATAANVYVQTVQSTNSRKLLFSDLQRGLDYRFQVRAYGPTGWSEWSDVVIIMVI